MIRRVQLHTSRTTAYAGQVYDSSDEVSQGLSRGGGVVLVGQVVLIQGDVTLVPGSVGELKVP